MSGVYIEAYVVANEINTGRSSATFLTAEWRDLVLLNYEVDPALLSQFVPHGTEIDHWNGKTFVSLVGFRFLNTYVWGMPIPFHRNFEEINLRFYVRRELRGEVRRGVVFIREIVPRRMIAFVARALYNERYVALPTSHEIHETSGGRAVEYTWNAQSCVNRIKLMVQGMPELPVPGSHEEFITEHYWGYVAQGAGGSLEYQVLHPQWMVWVGEGAAFEGDAAELYGTELSAVLNALPTSALLAEGSAVSVKRGRSL